MGYAFTFHVVKWAGGVPAGAYVHYPTISTTMLARVQARTAGHTNSAAISASPLRTAAKLLYYRVFMYYYALSLRTAAFVMVNSTWTKNHVDRILAHEDRWLDLAHFVPPLALAKLIEPSAPPKQARTVYPPCDTRAMADFPLEGRARVIVSVAQFRPEKDHAAQLHALHALLAAYPDMAGVKLVMVGGSRNAGDAARVDGLRALAEELGVAVRSL